MLLEDFVADLDSPINALDIIIDTAEEKMDKDWKMLAGGNKKVMLQIYAMIFMIRLLANQLIKLHQKYDNLVQEEYATGRVVLEI